MVSDPIVVVRWSIIMLVRVSLGANSGAAHNGGNSEILRIPCATREFLGFGPLNSKLHFDCDNTYHCY